MLWFAFLINQNVKFQCVWWQNTFLLLLLLFKMHFGPEKTAAFLGHVHIWLLHCVIELSILQKACLAVFRDNDEVFLSTCRDFSDKIISYLLMKFCLWAQRLWASIMDLWPCALLIFWDMLLLSISNIFHEMLKYLNSLNTWYVFHALL